MHYHDSQAERSRCFVLHRRQAAGEIANLEQQPRYPLVVQGHHIADYIADFRYLQLDPPKRVVEDTKGVRTPVYRLKCRLLKALWNIDVLES